MKFVAGGECEHFGDQCDQCEQCGDLCDQCEQCYDQCDQFHQYCDMCNQRNHSMICEQGSVIGLQEDCD